VTRGGVGALAGSSSPCWVAQLKSSGFGFRSHTIPPRCGGFGGALLFARRIQRLAPGLFGASWHKYPALGRPSNATLAPSPTVDRFRRSHRWMAGGPAGRLGQRQSLLYGDGGTASPVDACDGGTEANPGRPSVSCYVTYCIIVT